MIFFISSSLISTIFPILITKCEHCENKMRGSSFFFKLYFCYYKGSSYVNVVNSFLWINIWTFSKKAHEFAFHPWKGQSTSLNYPLAIVSNLHHVGSLAWLKKTYEKKLATNWTINKQLLCKKIQHLKNFLHND